MIDHRTKGILRLRLAIECVATTALFWIWFISYTAIVPSGEGVAAAPYFAYLAALLAGLLLETFTADFNKAVRQIQDPGLAAQLQASVRQTCFSVGILFLLLVLTKDRFMSRFFLVTFLPAEFFLLLILNRFAPRLLVRFLFNGAREERVLLIGPAEEGAKLEGWLNSKMMLGFRTVGFMSIQRSNSESPEQANPSTLANLQSLLTGQRVTLVILFGWISPEVCRELLGRTQRHGIRFLIYNNLSEQLRHPVVTFSDDGLAFFALRDEPLENPFNRVCKRLLDLVIALPSVLLVLPIAAIVIRLFVRAPLNLIISLALFVATTCSAAVITFRGENATNAASWRTPSALKAINPANNNIYGNDGYVMFNTTPANSTLNQQNSAPNPFTFASGTQTTLNVTPSYVSSFTAAASFNNVSTAPTFLNFDNPAGGTIKTGSAYAPGSTLTFTSLFTFTVNSRVPSSFVVGLFLTNNPGIIGQTQISGAGGTATGVRSTFGNVDALFFTINNAASGNVFTVSAEAASGFNGFVGITGITFDSVPEPTTLGGTAFAAFAFIWFGRRRKKLSMPGYC